MRRTSDFPEDELTFSPRIPSYSVWSLISTPSAAEATRP